MSWLYRYSLFLFRVILPLLWGAWTEKELGQSCHARAVRRDEQNTMKLSTKYASWSQTSWIFTSMTEEFNGVYRETTQATWSERELNPRPQDFKFSTLIKHWARLSPSLAGKTFRNHELRQCLLKGPQTCPTQGIIYEHSAAECTPVSIPAFQICTRFWLHIVCHPNTVRPLVDHHSVVSSH